MTILAALILIINSVQANDVGSFNQFMVVDGFSFASDGKPVFDTQTWNSTTNHDEKRSIYSKRTEDSDLKAATKITVESVPKDAYAKDITYVRATRWDWGGLMYSDRDLIVHARTNNNEIAALTKCSRLISGDPSKSETQPLKCHTVTPNLCAHLMRQFNVDSVWNLGPRIAQCVQATTEELPESVRLDIKDAHIIAMKKVQAVPRDWKKTFADLGNAKLAAPVSGQPDTKVSSGLLIASAELCQGYSDELNKKPEVSSATSSSTKK